MVPSIFGQFSLRDLIICLGNFLKASSRDYDHLIVLFLPKIPNMQYGPFIEGNKWNTLGGASVTSVVHFHACLS